MRGLIDKAQEQLLALEKAGRVFHCGAVFDDGQSIELTRGVDAFERKLNRIPIIRVENLLPLVIALRRAISLNNFDKSSFVTQTIASSILSDITASAYDLEEGVEFQYRDRYPSSFPYFRLPRVREIALFRWFD
jgi:hypothetical protein